MKGITPCSLDLRDTHPEIIQNQVKCNNSFDYRNYVVPLIL